MNIQTSNHIPLLRKQLRLKRRNISLSDQNKASFKANLKFLKHPWFKSAKHIAFYWPSDGEISPLLLLHIALNQGKFCYLPVVNSSDHSMEFKRYRRGEALRKNTYKILEPKQKNSTITAGKLDLVIMPLVGFDKKGTRIGMGGGYYDRAFAKVHAAKRKLIGLAFDFQEVPLLRGNDWDVPMHAVVTNKRIICF